jgi:putative endonuclease
MDRAATGADRQEIGRDAEDQAISMLEAKGYRILARNFSCRLGEVDIVAEHDHTVCFVEVRMRSTAAWGDPAHTVSGAKQRRIVKTAMHFLSAHRLWRRMIRFDVVSIVGRGREARLEHLPNAFDAGM